MRSRGRQTCWLRRELRHSSSRILPTTFRPSPKRWAFRMCSSSVRRGGERLRVTAQLIRANDGFHLWSQSYDRSPDDVIKIQEEVATEIARALETAMDPDALAQMVSSGTTSVPAYEAYLEALAWRAREGESGDELLVLKVRNALERAQQLDPQFAAAHWRMAQFWQNQMSVTSIGSELTSDTAEERKANYKIVIERAIATEKDPIRKKLYRANDAFVDLRYIEALKLITEFLANRPNDYEAIQSQLSGLMNLGRWDEAVPIAHHLADIGGEDSQSIQVAISNLVFANDATAAADMSRRALETYSDNAYIVYQAHRAFIWAGALDEARELMPFILSSQLPWFNHELASMRQACAEGDTAQALGIHEEFENRFQRGQAILWISYRLLGWQKQATSVLMSYDEADQFYALSSYLTYPYFDPRPFPKFMQVLERQGFDRPPPIDIPYGCNVPEGST